MESCVQTSSIPVRPRKMTTNDDIFESSSIGNYFESMSYGKLGVNK